MKEKERKGHDSNKAKGLSPVPPFLLPSYSFPHPSTIATGPAKTRIIKGKKKREKRKGRRMGQEDFIYSPEHQVVVCRLCGICLVPTRPAAAAAGRRAAIPWSNHLRSEPHRLKGDKLKVKLDVDF